MAHTAMGCKPTLNLSNASPLLLPPAPHTSQEKLVIRNNQWLWDYSSYNVRTTLTGISQAKVDSGRKRPLGVRKWVLR